MTLEDLYKLFKPSKTKILQKIDEDNVKDGDWLFSKNWGLKTEFRPKSLKTHRFLPRKGISGALDKLIEVSGDDYVEMEFTPDLKVIEAVKIQETQDRVKSVKVITSRLKGAEHETYCDVHYLTMLHKLGDVVIKHKPGVMDAKKNSPYPLKIYVNGEFAGLIMPMKEVV